MTGEYSPVTPRLLATVANRRTEVKSLVLYIIELLKVENSHVNSFRMSVGVGLIA